MTGHLRGFVLSSYLEPGSQRDRISYNFKTGGALGVWGNTWECTSGTRAPVVVKLYYCTVIMYWSLSSGVAKCKFRRPWVRVQVEVQVQVQVQVQV